MIDSGEGSYLVLQNLGDLQHVLSLGDVHVLQSCASGVPHHRDEVVSPVNKKYNSNIASRSTESPYHATCKKIHILTHSVQYNNNNIIQN